MTMKERAMDRYECHERYEAMGPLTTIDFMQVVEMVQIKCEQGRKRLPMPVPICHTRTYGKEAVSKTREMVRLANLGAATEQYHQGTQKYLDLVEKTAAERLRPEQPQETVKQLTLYVQLDAFQDLLKAGLWVAAALVVGLSSVGVWHIDTIWLAR
jgi:hypothetical protein